MDVEERTVRGRGTTDRWKGEKVKDKIKEEKFRLRKIKRKTNRRKFVLKLPKD